MMKRGQSRTADQRFKDSVPLTSSRKVDLLDRLDGTSSQLADADADRRLRRKSTRWAFRQCSVAVVIEHPAGGASRNLVCARNLSAGGMSFLHGGFLHAGSRCSVSLPQLDGQVVQAVGRVVNCRHVEGVVHEIGVRFDRPVDPRLFVSDAVNEGIDIGDGGAPDEARLPEAVLCVDDSEFDRQLLAHHLEGSNIELTAVGDGNAALEALHRRSFDVVLCGLNLPGTNGGDLIGEIRDQGFEGPIVLFTAETDNRRVQHGLEAGANSVLTKPYEPRQLLALLGELNPPDEAEGSQSLLYSTKEDEPGMARLIEAFIEQADRIAERIQRTVGEGRLDGARELCLNVKGTAASLGFAPLSDTAAEALAALDGAAALPEAEVKLREVSATCRRLAQHGDFR